MADSADSSRWPPKAERIPPIGGEPARRDLFGYYVWAEALTAFVQQIFELRNGQPGESRSAAHQSGVGSGSESFLILLEGSWGSGKSSLLEFLKNCIRESTNEKPRVVEFNAWMHQRSGPIWFALVEQVFLNAAGTKGRGPLARWWNTFWLRRRLRLLSFPLAVVLMGLPIIVGIVLAVAVFAIWFLTVATFGVSNSVSGLEIAGKVEMTYSLTVFFVVLAIWFSSRTRRFLSTAYSNSLSAVTFLSTKPNAVEHTKSHFRDGLRKHGAAPMLVLVDDLDRCDPDIVVDCLNALQTVLRSTRIVYIVAANRSWLRDCFEIHFQQLPRAGQRPGVTLGDLFLDKIFQLSLRVPSLSTELSLNYLQELLGQASTNQDKDASATPPDSSTMSSGNEPPRGADTKSLPAEILRTAREFLKGNPRLINRFAQEIKFKLLLSEKRVSHRDTELPIPCIWGWTLLRVRWPALADCFYDRPELLKWIPMLAAGTWSTRNEAIDAFPDAVREALGSAEFQDFLANPLFGLTDPQVVAECARIG